MTMKSWMNQEFPINYIVDGTYQVTELVPRLTIQGSMERVPPEPEDGRRPEPVRPPSGPSLSPLPPPHHGTDTRLEGDPELSGWAPGETLFDSVGEGG